MGRYIPPKETRVIGFQVWINNRLEATFLKMSSAQKFLLSAFPEITHFNAIQERGLILEYAMDKDGHVSDDKAFILHQST
jgi:hypothetical protein